MNYLLDTCVVSELWKPQPNSHVLAWLATCAEESLYLSALTIGEIRKGITKLPESPKKIELQYWLNQDLRQRFTGRILGITEHVAETWGDIQGNAEQHGCKMPVIDSLLAATGLTHTLTVVTRNTADIAASGVLLLNPWEFPLPSTDKDAILSSTEERNLNV
jgi:toxin FitB